MTVGFERMSALESAFLEKFVYCLQINYRPQVVNEHLGWQDRRVTYEAFKSLAMRLESISSFCLKYRLSGLTIFVRLAWADSIVKCFVGQ